MYNRSSLISTLSPGRPITLLIYCSSLTGPLKTITSNLSIALILLITALSLFSNVGSIDSPLTSTGEKRDSRHINTITGANTIVLIQEYTSFFVLTCKRIHHHKNISYISTSYTANIQTLLTLLFKKWPDSIIRLVSHFWLTHFL